MAANTSCSVLVTNISPKANEKTVSDFFSFCGKVTNLTLRSHSDGSEAIVTFENEGAAKTALLLTSALIVDRPITVVPHSSGIADFPASLKDIGDSSAAHHQQIELEGDQISNRPQPNIPADSRTRTSVIASLIAAGYTLSADAARTAREFDEERQISSRINTAAENLGAKIKEIDEQYQLTKTVEELSDKVAEKARVIDSQLHLSETAATVSAAVAAGAQNVQAKIQQEPAINSAWNTFVTTTSQLGEKINTFIAPATTTIKAEMDDISVQSKALIKEKMKERGFEDPDEEYHRTGQVLEDSSSMGEPSSFGDSQGLLKFDDTASPLTPTGEHLTTTTQESQSVPSLSPTSLESYSLSDTTTSSTPTATSAPSLLE